jgi:hypothetical protein
MQQLEEFSDKLSRQQWQYSTAHSCISRPPASAGKLDQILSSPNFIFKYKWRHILALEIVPGFKRLDCQMELMKTLVKEDFNLDQTINVQNNQRKIVLHMVAMDNLHSDLVELLMSVKPLIWIHTILVASLHWIWWSNSRRLLPSRKSPGLIFFHWGIMLDFCEWRFLSGL